jgi:hypothetical protein
VAREAQQHLPARATDKDEAEDHAVDELAGDGAEREQAEHRQALPEEDIRALVSRSVADCEDRLQAAVRARRLARRGGTGVGGGGARRRRGGERA